MNEIGLGIARDPTKAIELYKEAAEQNIIAAEARLGEIYLNGELIHPTTVRQDLTLIEPLIMAILIQRCCWVKYIVQGLERP